MKRYIFTLICLIFLQMGFFSYSYGDLGFPQGYWVFKDGEHSGISDNKKVYTAPPDTMSYNDKGIVCRLVERTAHFELYAAIGWAMSEDPAENRVRLFKQGEPNHNIALCDYIAERPVSDTVALTTPITTQKYYDAVDGIKLGGVGNILQYIAATVSPGGGQGSIFVFEDRYDDIIGRIATDDGGNNRFTQEVGNRKTCFVLI